MSLGTPTTIAFGKTDYSSPLSGNISLGTDGSIVYSGVFEGSGIGTPGQLEIIDTASTVVEVSCANGVLARVGGGTLALTVTLVVGAGNTAAYGTTPLCAGLGTVVATHILTATAADNLIILGGRLTPTSLNSGAYSTSHAGGTPVAVRVLVI